jgi:hypothetical protein
MKTTCQTTHATTARPASRLPVRVAGAFAAVAVLTAAMASVTSCDVVRQITGTYNMVNCKYEYRSLEGVAVAGIDLSQGLSLMDAPRILGLLAAGGGQSLPVALTVNLDVRNPGATEALMNGMEWSLSIDGVHFTSGALARRLAVAPGGSGVLPLAMTFDVAGLLRGESRNAVVGVVRNLAGLGGLGGGASEPSRVTLSLRPSFDVGGRAVASPVAIPVNFSFGGR